MAASSTAQELFTALLSAGDAALRPPPPDDRPHPTVHACVPPASRLAGATLVVDVDGALLHRRSPLSLFPYFMLVALEAGGFLRGLALLLLYPAIACLPLLPGGSGDQLAVQAMAFVAFCGLRAGAFRAGRAVLPRWLLEDVAAEALRVALRRGGAGGDPARVVWASAMPRVMVEPFLREYLLVPPAAAVAAREMKTLCGFYTGVMAGGDGCGKVISELRKKKAGDDDNNVVGFSGGGSMEFLRRPLASICKVPVK
jgi:glycerol-3-phosphate acyltransferase